MFAVTVSFTLHAGAAERFRPLVEANARASVDTEDGCRRFDVCTDPSRPDQVFLYELYDDEAAFQAHMKTAHFTAFDGAVGGMVADKTVLTFGQVVS